MYKNYLLFFLFVMGIQLYAMEEQSSPEIAINSKGMIVECEDGFGNHQLFVPIVVYGKDKSSYGISIPLEALESANDGDQVIDNYDGSGNLYIYKCNQSRASSGQTFKQA